MQIRIGRCMGWKAWNAIVSTLARCLCACIWTVDEVLSGSSKYYLKCKTYKQIQQNTPTALSLTHSNERAYCASEKDRAIESIVQTVYHTLTAQPSRIQRWAKGKFAKVRVVCFCWRNIVMFAPRTYTHIPTVNVVAKRHAYMIFHSIFPLFTSFRCDFLAGKFAQPTDNLFVYLLCVFTRGVFFHIP